MSWLRSSVVLLSALLFVASAANGASGQATELSNPTPTQVEDEPEDDYEPDLYIGPRIELAFSYYVLSDGQGGGDVFAGSFGGYLPLDIPLRLGISAEIGIRDYSLADPDLILGGNLSAGYKHLGFDRVVPYVAAVGTMGGLFGQRFNSLVTHFIVGAGAEIGADFRLINTLAAGMSFSYVRATMRDLAYDLFVLRFKVSL